MQSGPGIDPTRVTTVAEYPLGYEAGDPRAQDFPNNIIRYSKASGAGITVGVPVKLDVAATDEPGSIVVSTAASPLFGIAHVAIPSASFGWVTVHGKVLNAVVPDGGVAGVQLGTGAAALVDISTAPTAALATAAATGRGCVLLQDTGTALGTVWVE